MNAFAAEAAATVPGFTVRVPLTGPAPRETDTLSMSSASSAVFRFAAGSFSRSAARMVGSSFSSSLAVTHTVAMSYFSNRRCAARSKLVFPTPRAAWSTRTRPMNRPSIAKS